MAADPVEALVSDFVAQLRDVIRGQIRDALDGRFSGSVGGKRSASATGSKGHHKGEKRSADELEALSSKLLTFIRSNEGLRVEEINRKLGTTTKDLALPIRKLIAEGAIKGKGQKRSRAYFVTRGAKGGRPHRARPKAKVAG